MSRPDFDMYPDEEVRVAQLLTKLGNQFDFSQGKYGPDGPDRRIFESAVQAEFDKIGLKVRINWEQMTYPDGTYSNVYRPGVEPYGRSKEEGETDHDRWQWGVTKGLMTGEPGYVREDGSKHEDPKRKLILP